MKVLLTITHNYLGIPIKTASKEEQNLHVLNIYSKEQQIMEFRIPVTEMFPSSLTYKSENKYFHSNVVISPLQASEIVALNYDYLSYINVTEYKGKELCFSGTFPSSFFEQIVQTNMPNSSLEVRPKIHFTADRGWINDPNGLVFHNGIWHLFFQYNPMNSEWENMSWGHAISKDLLHWQQKDTVMYPDEYGTIFSGCGLVNTTGLLGLPKDALLFFYTAAGGTNKWSEGKQFVQRLAYSLDGGNTLIKHPNWKLRLFDVGNAVFENRDPKLFWHEDSQAYIMVLFLEAHDFAIFRSENLEDWEKTQQLSFEHAWECPDLMKLKADDDTEHWVFWSADGFYFIGEFDGFSFTILGKQQEAYGTKLPYAAQTYAGIFDRTISVAWLRSRNDGHLYTGSMSIPRELSLVKKGNDYWLRLTPVREIEQMLESFQTLYMTNGCVRYKLTGCPIYLLIDWNKETLEKDIFRISGVEVTIDRKNGIIQYDNVSSKHSETYMVSNGELINQLCIIVDCGIIEITANYDIIYLAYETTDYQMDDFLTYEGEEADIRVALLKNRN